MSNPGLTTSSGGGAVQSTTGHCPVLRTGAALGCNYCWNTVDERGRILRRKTKYHCPDCQANLCIVPCFQDYHEKFVSSTEGQTSGPQLKGPTHQLLPKMSSIWRLYTNSDRLRCFRQIHNWFCIIGYFLFTMNVFFSNNIHADLTFRRGILYFGFQVLNGTLYFTNCYVLIISFVYSILN